MSRERAGDTGQVAGNHASCKQEGAGADRQHSPD